MEIEHIIGVIVVLVAGGLILAFAVLRRFSPHYTLRPMRAFQELQRALGLAVEDGKRLHISLGRSSLLEPTNASALVGLSTLERVSQVGMISDRPPIATSGDPALAVLSRDTLRASYNTAGIPDQYQPYRGRLTGVTPFSYIAGAFPIIHTEQVSTHIFSGNFGPEIGLLSEAASREKAFVLGASDSLPAQAVLLATTPEPLIGEELFAIPAYLDGGPVHQASLRTQDILRWVLVAALIVGAILKVLRIL